MDFDESKEYLYSLGNEVSAMKLGLENIRTLLTALGEPQNRYLKVQVAGTNGKGSVCAFLDSICNTAGIKTGTFTSPHLVSITERIRINGEDISEEDFAHHATFIRETAERLLEKGDLEYRPTFFEQMTAIALTAFAEAKIKLAILETGLGGRLDATTAANAEIAAITRIDLDHQEYLGDTIQEVAAEKAAVIHSGSIVVVAEQDPAATQVISERLNLFGIHARKAEQVKTRQTGRLKFITEKGEYELNKIGLRGQHQMENAKVAILLAEALQDYFPISPLNIIGGLETAIHPGRLEFVGRYLLDGAHNPAGAKALRYFLDESVTQPVTMVFGALKGKHVVEIAELLFSKADKLILTQPENSRAMSAAEIISQIPEDLLPKQTILTDNVDEALKKAADVTSEGGLILITGSLYLVGQAKKTQQDNSQI